MAQIVFAVEIEGGDDEIVVTPKSVPSKINFGTPASLVLAIQNRSAVAKTFPEIKVAVAGTAKEKVTATLLQTSLVLQPISTKDLTITLEAGEAVFKGEKIEVRVAATSE